MLTIASLKPEHTEVVWGVAAIIFMLLVAIAVGYAALTLYRRRNG